MRRAAGPTVSLFPFLTVLLCASGTLIVLLIALSRHVRETPVLTEEPPAAPAEAVEPEPSPVAEPAPPRPPRVVVLPPDPADDPAVPLRARLVAARAEAEKIAAATAAAVGERDRFVCQAAAVRGENGELSEAAAALRTRAAGFERSAAASADALSRAAAEAAALRAKAEAAAADDSPAALLPVVRTADGSQTTRPILIECGAGGAELKPYGAVVPTAAAGPEADGSSPLAAGVKAAARATGEGYALLIVRPDGLPAFYRAANALTAAGIDFGYELLDDGAEVAWGEASGEDTAAVAAAVRAALLARYSAAGRTTGGGAGGADPFGDGETGGGGFAAGEGGEPSGGGNSEADRRRALSGAFRSGSPADRIAVGGVVRDVPITGGESDRPRRLPAGTRGAFDSAAAGGAASGAAAPAGSSPAGEGTTMSDTAVPLFAQDGEVGRARSGGFQPPTDGGAAGDAVPAARSGSATGRRSGGAAGGSPAAERETINGPSGDRPAAGTGGSGPPGGPPGRSSGPTAGRGRGGARGRELADTRIAYAVRVPAVLASSHLWVGGRWVPLPGDPDALAATLAAAVDSQLADRGAPPAGFRWSPEVRLEVRNGGQPRLSAVTAALEAAGATVTRTRARR